MLIIGKFVFFIYLFGFCVVFSGSIECGSKSIVSVSVECCSCLVGTGFSRAIKGSMARRSTNNSMSAMMAVSDENSIAQESSPTSISEPSQPVSSQNSSSTTAGELPQDNPALTQAFSRALEESLPGIFAAVRAQVGGSPSSSAHGLVSTATNLGASPSTSYNLSGPPTSTGNLTVPSFISTYCTLDNAQPHVAASTPSFVSQPLHRDGLVRPSWTGGGDSTSLDCLPSSLALPTGSLLPSTSGYPALAKAFVVGPGYAPVPNKLVTKITAGMFIELADLLAENIKAQEIEPQAFLEGRLLVSSSKKRVVEVTDILSWIEAFTIYSLILCQSYPARWTDLSQYKLLIIQTAKRFPGLAWLHYDGAFRKEAAATGLTDWSRMNLDLYNFHTRVVCIESTTTPQPTPLRQSSTETSGPSVKGQNRQRASRFCHSWNDHGHCRWPYGQCRFLHKCESCSGDHPSVKCPYRGGGSASHRERSPPPFVNKRRR